MRIEDLFGNNQLNEGPFGPYGIVQKAKDTATSKVKGVVGSGQVEQGNIASGEMANQHYKDFKNYIGRVVGAGQKFVEAKHLLSWMQAKGMDPKMAGKRPQDLVSPQDVKDIIMKATRVSQQNPSVEPEQSAPAPAHQSEPQSTPQEEKPESASPTPAPTKASVDLSSLSAEDRQKLIKFLSM